MFYNFFKSVPMELDEAANIDGAGAWRLYWNIIAPISKPVFGALFILDFVATWNEFAMASTLMQDQKMYLIPQAIQNFNTQHASSWGQVNAFVISTMLPVLVMYLIFQRFFTSGALSGAVKG
jgi:raffinose/stachyose/melibiose transport system permease protein